MSETLRTDPADVLAGLLEHVAQGLPPVVADAEAANDAELTHALVHLADATARAREALGRSR